MSKAQKFNTVSLGVAAAGCLALAWSALMFWSWLSDPHDMFRGNNPGDMTVWGVISAASVAAIYFGMKHRRLDDS